MPSVIMLYAVYADHILYVVLLSVVTLIVVAPTKIINTKTEKVKNFHNHFQNDPCIATGNRNGTCYTS